MEERKARSFKTTWGWIYDRIFMITSANFIFHGCEIVMALLFLKLSLVCSRPHQVCLCVCVFISCWRTWVFLAGGSSTCTRWSPMTPGREVWLTAAPAGVLFIKRMLHALMDVLIQLSVNHLKSKKKWKITKKKKKLRYI